MENKIAFFKVIGATTLAFSAPILLVYIYDHLVSARTTQGRSRRTSFRSKYSIVDEDESASVVNLPEKASIGTWNAIGLQRPMVIAMVIVSFTLVLLTIYVGGITSSRQVLYREDADSLSPLDWF